MILISSHPYQHCWIPNGREWGLDVFAMLSLGTLKLDRMLAMLPSIALYAEKSDYLFFYYPRLA
jgi:hypothetical protein